MGAVVVDSCVLIGLLNANDSLHDASSTALVKHHETGDQFVLPASVLAETLVGVVRVQPGRVANVTSLLDILCGPVRVVDSNVAAETARLRARHKSLRLEDALVVATGVVDDVDTILTADKRLARIDKRVKVL